MLSTAEVEITGIVCKGKASPAGSDKVSYPLLRKELVFSSD